MKRKLALLIGSLCLLAGSGQAAELSHYAEFARAYGIVRYFSPNPYTEEWSESDWMKVCTLLVSRIDTQPLEQVFRPLAPTLVFSEEPTPPRSADTPDAPARYYSYSGSGELHIPLIARLLTPGLARYIPYYKRLERVADRQDTVAAPQPGTYYTYRVAEGRYLHIQHALPKEQFDGRATRRLLAEAKSYWDNHRSADKALSPRRSFIFGLLADPAVRTADLTVRWNIIRHFYPYYEEEGLDWEPRLEEYLQEAVGMEPPATFEAVLGWHDLLCRFFHPIRDGHLFVRRDMTLSGLRSTYLPAYYADVETVCVNDTLLIRTAGASWRVLHAIDGRPAAERMERCRTVTCAATDGHRDVLAARELFAAAAYGTPFVIRSSDPSGTERIDTLYACQPDAPMPQREGPAIRRSGEGILYVDASSPEVTEKRFLAALTPDIKALCFDLRGLPSVRFEAILAHLITADAAAPATEVPITRFPFQEGVAWRIGSETLRAKAPHVALPATFLCDAGIVSWGETILLIVRHYHLGEIVGQPTAGTTGDMTQFALPLFPFSMTGMRMRGMDGEPHHARGIVPDRIVPRYASDRMTDRDRTLETALDAVR